MGDQDLAAGTFLSQSRDYLASGLLPRIERAVQMLTDDQLWWRPNEESNSIGNLVLHLAGNVRQWIVCGVGGKADVRERDEEFSRRSVISKTELLNMLGSALSDADEILRGLSPSVLSERRTIQGLNVTVLEAIYHVVEHFSMHTGQILYIGKLLTGKDLHLYGFDEHGNATKRW